MRSDALAQFRLSRNMMSSFLAGLFLRCTLRRKTDAGMADQLIKDHEHGRQHEDAAKIQQLLAGMEAISTGLNQLDAGINKLRSGDDGKGGLARTKVDSLLVE